MIFANAFDDMSTIYYSSLASYIVNHYTVYVASNANLYSKNLIAYITGTSHIFVCLFNIPTTLIRARNLRLKRSPPFVIAEIHFKIGGSGGREREEREEEEEGEGKNKGDRDKETAREHEERKEILNSDILVYSSRSVQTVKEKTAARPLTTPVCLLLQEKRKSNLDLQSSSLLSLSHYCYSCCQCCCYQYSFIMVAFIMTFIMIIALLQLSLLLLLS